MTQRLAHVADDGREQTVRAHLDGTAELARSFAAPFGAGDQADFSGKMHDVGKYSDAFQRRLLQNGPKVDHATAGAYECFLSGRMAEAFCVAAHHSGLMNLGGRTDAADKPTFHGRMAKARQGKIPDYAAWRMDGPDIPPPAVRLPGNAAELSFYIRMLYSCLTDADFLDTETFMAGNAVERGRAADWAELSAGLDSHISSWMNPPPGSLNAQRTAILRRCMEAGAAEAPGLFTLTVPTGGGKTVASLAFAIRHAVRWRKRRIIYVIPYTSIIEQTAAEFRKILGDGNVLEHHSQAEYDAAADGELTPDAMRLLRTTENWDMPVVVTTAVQFFESLFAAKSSRCRKLHNVADSVVIFDEAQMLPVPYLRPCVWAIAQLAKEYGVSAVLCTATQPALDGLFAEFLPGAPIHEICPASTFDASLFRRVTFENIGRVTADDLATQLAGSTAGLCIVNSRASAREVYEALPPDGSFHLSTLMAPIHRKARLTEIRGLLTQKDGPPCRVVSTSLIEAGVDVDFPAVWREEAGLDSVLQAAGRCNREGRRPREESLVRVFSLTEQPVPLFRVNTECFRSVALSGADIASPEAIRAYFRQLLVVKGQAALDRHDIMKDLYSLNFAEVAERFHLIDNQTHTVYIPCDEMSRGLIAALREGQRTRRLLRALGAYAVNIYDKHFAALYASGDIDLLEDGSAVLVNDALYNEYTGLSLEADAGKALFG